MAWRGWAGRGTARHGQAGPGKARHGTAGFSTRNRYSVTMTGAGRGQDRSVVTILLEKILWGTPDPPPKPPPPPPEPDGG